MQINNANKKIQINNAKERHSANRNNAKTQCTINHDKINNVKK